MPTKTRSRTNGASARSIQARRPARRDIVKQVGNKFSGMDLEKAMVLLHTALAIAIVIKQSRSKKSPRKAEPFRSAVSVLNHYLNEGRELTEMQRETLEDIKEELRMLSEHEGDGIMSPAR
jgi:Flp pilus assembly protein TadB